MKLSRNPTDISIGRRSNACSALAAVYSCLSALFCQGFSTSYESFPMTPFRFSRRAALAGLGTAALVGGAGALALRARSHKGKKEPRNRVPLASSSWVNRVRDFHGQIDRGDFQGAAESAGYLTNE